MDKQISVTLAQAMAEYEARGGKVTQCEPGARALPHVIDPALVGCQCGCKGNYTEHSMREGETGGLSMLADGLDFLMVYGGY